MSLLNGFSAILKELRLMRNQPTSRFILMYLLSVIFVITKGLGLWAALYLYIALNHTGLL